MENPTKMDDLGVPPFQETTIYPHEKHRNLGNVNMAAMALTSPPWLRNETDETGGGGQGAKRWRRMRQEREANFG